MCIRDSHGTHQAPQRGVVHANGLQKHHHSRTGGHKQTGCCQHGRPPSFPASACRPSARQAQPRPNRAPLPLPSAAAKHKLAAIRQAKFVFCARSIRSLLFRCLLYTSHTFRRPRRSHTRIRAGQFYQLLFAYGPHIV